MSAYIVSNKTISLIARAFNDYGVPYHAENYDPSDSWIGGCMAFIDSQKLTESIGQSLLDQNYKSVNYRYGEDEETPKFEYENVDEYITDLGAIIGCIRCYNYQACETPMYETTDLYESLMNLKEKIYERAIKRLGYEEPWGID